MATCGNCRPAVLSAAGGQKEGERKGTLSPQPPHTGPPTSVVFGGEEWEGQGLSTPPMRGIPKSLCHVWLPSTLQGEMNTQSIAPETRMDGASATPTVTLRSDGQWDRPSFRAKNQSLESKRPRGNLFILLLPGTVKKHQRTKLVQLVAKKTA